MKIYSWNVNGLRAVLRKGALEEFLSKHSPDVILFQEIKGKIEVLPDEVKGDDDKFLRHYFPAEKAGYSGVSIWVSSKLKKHNPKFSNFSAGVNDDEGRIAQVIFDDLGLTIFSVYVPNGGKSDQAFQDKILFFDEYKKKLSKYKDMNVVIGGDMNVAKEEIDVERYDRFSEHTNFCKEIRDKFSNFISTDLSDRFREENPTLKGAYTYWDNFDFSLPRGVKPREVNRGWRLDYLLVDKKIKSKNPQIHNDVYGSDHCPISIDIVLN